MCGICPLTTSADTGTSFTGDTGVDTFNGVVGTDGLVANGTTLNPGDNLVGGDGIDKLAVSISGDMTAAQTTSAVTLTSIETVSISNFDADAALMNTIDLSLASDVTTVALFASSASGDTTISGIQSVVAAQMSNGSGDLTLTYADAAVTGTTDIQTLELSAVTAGTFVVAGATTGGVETLAITSSGAARNVLTGITDDTNLTTITVAGTQALTLGTVGVSVDTLDASSNSGGLTATLSALVDQTVTGSSGNDVITAGTNLTGTDAAVNAGDGTADTLAVTANAVIAVAADGARYTNFETLSVVNSAVATTARAQNMALISGITGLNATMNNTSTATGADTTMSVTYTNLAATTNTLNITGLTSAEAGANVETVMTVNATRASNTAADAMTVNLGTATAISGATRTAVGGAAGGIILAVSLANEESITINSLGGTGSNFVGALTNTAATSVTATGDNALSFASMSSTVVTTIDASAMTAAFIMGTNAGTVASTISGGTGADTLTGGTAADSMVGGAGNDSITGAAGNDSISGDAGDDTINAGDGVDSITAGAGNDTIAVTTVGDFINLASAEVVIGGDGNDNLSFDSAVATTIAATDLAGISGIETITIDGTAQAGSVTLTDAVYTANGATTLAIVDGDLTQGTLTVDASALTSANSITVTANTATMSDSLVGGAGNDTFTFAGATGLEAGDTVNGGSGTADTISVDASAAATLVMTAVTNIENITLTGNGTGTITIDVIDANITTAVAATTTVAATAVGSMTFDASSLTNGTGLVDYDGSLVTTTTKVQNLTGSEGADTLVGGSGNDIISGGSLGDTITGGIGIDSLTGGTGDDQFNIGASAQFVGLTTVETVSGGTGSDTILVSTGAANIAIAASDLLGISSIETISILNATGQTASITLSDAVFTANGATTLAITSNVASAAGITVDASALTSTNSVQLSGTQIASLNDTLTGGAGNDTFTFTMLAAGIEDELSATDVVTGGAGTDTLVIATGTTALDAVTLTNVATIEKITVTGTTGGVGLITLADANFAAITGATISATSLTTGALLVTAAAEDDSTFSITGGAGADSIIGGQLADTISGGSGADTITGGLLADSLSGGAGIDRFVYALATQSNSTNTDTITDFTTGTDKLDVTLDYSGFSSALTVNATVQTAAAGTTAAQDALSGARGEAIYDTTNSALIINFNADNLITTSDYKISINAASTPASSIAEGDINFTITTGSGADTITAGGGADTITAGTGADTITIGAGVNVINQLTGASGSATASVADTITDFTAATAAIEIGTWTGDATAGTGNYVEVADATYANYAAVLVALNAAAATLAGTSAATLLVVFAADDTGTDTGYVGIDRDGGGTIDEVIILTGIVAAGISVADIT